MRFDTHLYSSKLYRPKPLHQFNEEIGLLTILTPWGSRQKIEPLADYMQDFITTYVHDPEATTPFQKQPHLSLETNALYIAAQAASKNLYSTLNEEELRGGFELLLVLIKDQTLTWVQCGHPHIILERSNKKLLPIHVEVDLSTELEEQSRLSPLPAHLLGVTEHPRLNWGQIQLQAQDKIILLSRTWIPAELYQLKSTERNLNKIAHTIVANDPEQPFWLGVLQTS